MTAAEKRAYRGLFIAAAATNFLYTLVGGLFPDTLFGLVGAATPDEWNVVVPLIGICGVLYAFAAWRPDWGDLPVGIGLATKVLGPQAWLVQLMFDQTTPRLFPLLLVGDLVWWLPFLMYLFRRLRMTYVLPAAWCFGIHALANFHLLGVRGGTELVADPAARQAYIAQHVWLWSGTWLLWALASLSLLSFCIVWAWQLPVSRWWRGTALLLVALGLVGDLCGETILIVRATERGLPLNEFVLAIDRYRLLGPVLANGLYCLGGLMLSWSSWQCGFLRGGDGWIGLVMWAAGCGLTVAALANHRQGMVATGAAVMLLFLVFNFRVTRRLTIRRNRELAAGPSR